MISYTHSRGGGLQPERITAALKQTQHITSSQFFPICGYGTQHFFVDSNTHSDFTKNNTFAIVADFLFAFKKKREKTIYMDATRFLSAI